MRVLFFFRDELIEPPTCRMVFAMLLTPIEFFIIVPPLTYVRRWRTPQGHGLTPYDIAGNLQEAREFLRRHHQHNAPRFTTRRRLKTPRGSREDDGTTVPVPNWVTETPDDTSYYLTMFDRSGGPHQDIEITREEFILLKARLAEERGYPVSEEKPGLSTLFEDLMTVSDVAERVRMSRSWVLAHSSGNKRPQIQCARFGRSVRFRSADVETFIQDCLRLSGRPLRGYKTPPES